MHRNGNRTCETRKPPPLERWSNRAFWVVAAAFLAASVVLAAVNNTAGSNDSRNNLETARNLAAGRGFQSNLVQQLFEQQPLPNPETIRPPGIPFLMAGLFRVFGISLAIQVLVNAATVFATAWLLRWAIRTAGGGWFGSMAGILTFLSGNYEIHSIWYSNIFVLCTTGLLCLAALKERRAWNPWILATACGLIAVIGFLMKPTYVITAVPFAAFLLMFRTGDADEHPVSRRTRFLSFLWFLVILVLLTSPYWARNLTLFGRPLYSPALAGRLLLHYDSLPYGWGFTVRFGNPVTYGELIERHGILGLTGREVLAWLKTGWAIGILNAPLVLLVVLGLFLLRGRVRWNGYLLPLLTILEPIFSAAIYSRAEYRYLWPIYPSGLYLIGLGIRDFPTWLRSQPAAAPKVAACFRSLLVLGLLFGAYRAEQHWRTRFVRALQSSPAWVSIVGRIPEDAVVMTDNPYSVAWYGQRKAVRCAGGPRKDLLSVIELYRPTYYLHTGSRRYHRLHGKLAFLPGELRLIATGQGAERKEKWEFCKLNIQEGTQK